MSLWEVLSDSPLVSCFAGHDRHDKASHPMAAFATILQYAKDLTQVSSRL